MGKIPKIRRPKPRRRASWQFDGPSTEENLLNILLPLGGAVPMTELQLARELFVPVAEIRRAMNAILLTGQVSVSGDGWRRRYVGVTRAMVQ